MSQYTLVQKCKSVNILMGISTKEQSLIRKNILKTPLYGQWAVQQIVFSTINTHYVY